MEGADTTREGRELGSATEAMSLLKRKHCGCNISLIFYFPFFFFGISQVGISPGSTAILRFLNVSYIQSYYNL